MTERLKLTKWDCLLIALLLCLGLGFVALTAGAAAGGDTVQVLEEDRVIFEHTLSEAVSFEKELALSNGEHISIRVKNGAVSMLHSDCPDKTCQKTGQISRTGEIIVCLPNRVVIKITGAGGDEIDGKTY